MRDAKETDQRAEVGRRIGRVVMHPVFGSSKCITCGNPAELVKDPYYRWRCCGQSWVKIGSPMDVANELIAASDEDA